MKKKSSKYTLDDICNVFMLLKDDLKKDLKMKKAVLIHMCRLMKFISTGTSKAVKFTV